METSTAGTPTPLQLANREWAPGVNFGVSLEAPADGSWNDGRVLKPDPAYMDMIADAGFKSVRIPIRWSDHAEVSSPYTIRPDFLRAVDGLIERALSRGLRVLINVHHYNEFYEDPPRHLVQFLELWRQIATYYRQYDRDRLWFEILNEPHHNMSQEQWQGALNAALVLIRDTNPTRPVMFGGSPWNGWQSLLSVAVPKDDYLVATFHYYLPFDFTHQGAAWVDEKERVPVGKAFEGTDRDRAAIAAHFAQVKVWADRHRLPVNVGEFGAYERADMASRVIYTRTVRHLLDAFGFSWHYWEFGANFGIYDPRTQAFHQPLLRALIDP